MWCTQEGRSAIPTRVTTLCTSTSSSASRYDPSPTTIATSVCHTVSCSILAVAGAFTVEPSASSELECSSEQAGAPSDASGGKGLKRASSSGKIGPMERARSARSRADPSLSGYSSPSREMVPSVGSVPLASVACSDISWPAEGDGGGGPTSERSYSANIDPHSFQYAHQGALRALPACHGFVAINAVVALNYATMAPRRVSLDAGCVFSLYTCACIVH